MPSVPVRTAAWARAAAIAPLTLVAAAVQAQTWVHELNVQTEVLATDNSLPGSSTAPKTSDLLLLVEPGLRLGATGSAVNLRLDAGVAFIGSARGSVPGSTQPHVDGLMNATLVPRLLFLDAAVTVRQVEADPFAGRVTELAAANRRTSATYRIAPMLRHEFANNVEVLARQEEILQTNTSVASGVDQSADQRTHNTLLRVERLPVPLGASVQFDRNDSRTEGGGIDTYFTVDSVRGQLSYAVAGADLVVGVVGGHERADSTTVRVSDKLYGLAMHWEPSSRTQANVSAEHHFFGVGGSADLRMRTAQSALFVRARREMNDIHSEVIDASAATDATTLAASVVAGIPVAQDEATAEAGQPGRPPRPRQPVQTMGEQALGRRGFSIVLPGVVDIAAGYPQLDTSFDGRWVLIGRRNTVTLELYGRNTRQLTEGLVAGAPVANADTRQWGTSVSFNHRLDPVTTLDLSTSLSRIEGLGARAGDVTRQGNVRANVIRQLSPRTTLVGGIRFEQLRSNINGVRPYDATSIAVGLNHRF